jgi:hypothetical protein
MGNNASVSIDDGRIVAGDLSGQELEQVQRFVDFNRGVLLDYWEKRIDTDQTARSRRLAGRAQLRSTPAPACSFEVDKHQEIRRPL